MIELISRDRAFGELAGLVEAGGEVRARGIVGSSATLLAAALQRALGRPMLLVTAHLDEADEAVDELASIGVDAARFPAMEVLPGESAVSLELAAERLALLGRLRGGARRQDPGGHAIPAVIVASIHALMQAVPPAERLGDLMRSIRPGDRLSLPELAAWLTEAGYRRVETIESPGEFAVRGGIVDVFGPTSMAVRIDLFDDEVEGLSEVDLDTMGSDRRLPQADLVAVSAGAAVPADAGSSLAGAMPAGFVTVLAEMLEIAEQGRSYMERASDATAILTPADVQAELVRTSSAVIELSQYAAAPQGGVELPVEALPSFAEGAAEAVGELAELSRNARTIVLCQNEGEEKRMRELLSEFAHDAPVEVRRQYLHRGFVWGDPDATAFVPHHELLHRYHVRRGVQRVALRTTDRFAELEPGDFVVHRDHGIARFVGLGPLQGTPGTQEFLTLEFAGGARLHGPAASIDLVHKYLGAFAGTPELSHFGGRRWAKQKEAVGEAVRDLAAEMLRIQAARAATLGIRYPADTPWQKEFEAEFPYEETEDQLTAIAEVKKDMSDPQPADRLICGDVGFGKTEVAIRAAFKAAEFGKQVAVLVPTTVLAEQHERTFRQRFADYPFRIESLSRFKAAGQQKLLLEALHRGQVDVIIGTHRLLSKDVRFADLGLVIIDEEQRFGVRHKQRLLEFRLTADVLTLSATPIPRTLHMAMLRLRSISSLATPPLDRRAIVTEVLSFDRQRVGRAIRRELAREGQVFFVHNRVYDIDRGADTVRSLAPQARVLVGHGQMPTRTLERVMLAFLRREADILVCTTIIESGIDIPTANTMFVSNAHHFGLSELHQLRGRVGRYKHRAYCYLLLPQDRVLSEIALRRLKAIEQFSMLGAGFKIALRDLEIRGAGNLLGPQQSGHIASVGYEMYCRLLEHAVGELTEPKGASPLDTTIDLGLEGSLPPGYIPSAARRMEASRRLSRAERANDVRRAAADLESAYGQLPASARILVRLAELRAFAASRGIRSITRMEGDVILAAERPQEIRARFDGAKGTVRIVGVPVRRGLTTVYYRPPKSWFDGDSILTVLIKRLDDAAPAILESSISA